MSTEKIVNIVWQEPTETNGVFRVVGNEEDLTTPVQDKTSVVVEASPLACPIGKTAQTIEKLGIIPNK
ncbi:MAG: hypothetical protein KME52_27940 [Desmonostoc geniculatum HA4340-LM1]|jgi:hypothetical protein|nr:hypothetical protein [Desmonostoc geniculatum HA4340-LM1]